MPRITSAGTYIEFKHGEGSADTTHVQALNFQADISGGTFRLRVNGELTNDIAWTGTEATDVASINTALDALPSLEVGDLVCAGSDQTALTITGASNGFYRIMLDPDTQALTGNTSADDDLITSVTTYGGVWIALSADTSEFNYEETAETVDVTGMSEEARQVVQVASTASISMSLYEANQAWASKIYSGVQGRVRVFNEGKVAGKKYLEAYVIIETVSGNNPDHDVIEKELSGMRQGAWKAHPDSIWKGS